MLSLLLTESDANKSQVAENPDQAPNIYQRYVNAAQKQYLQGKNKTQAAVQDKKVNIAMTKHDSIFPNIHLPGGISSKVGVLHVYSSSTSFKPFDDWDTCLFLPTMKSNANSEIEQATEYKNLAMEGNDWRSPIFKLGSASTSSNIPEATKGGCSTSHSCRPFNDWGPSHRESLTDWNMKYC